MRSAIRSRKPSVDCKIGLILAGNVDLLFWDGQLERTRLNDVGYDDNRPYRVHFPEKAGQSDCPLVLEEKRRCSPEVKEKAQNPDDIADPTPRRRVGLLDQDGPPILVVCAKAIPGLYRKGAKARCKRPEPAVPCSSGPAVRGASGDCRQMNLRQNSRWAKASATTSVGQQKCFAPSSWTSSPILEMSRDASHGELNAFSLNAIVPRRASERGGVEFEVGIDLTHSHQRDLRSTYHPISLGGT